MRIVILGAPGAGKGTQCKRIVEKYGLSHLSSGDILRKERSEGTDLGKKARGYMDSGGLVPDDLIVQMMAGAIRAVSDRGFVLDGFPRTVNQAGALDRSMGSNGQKIDVVLNLNIDDAKILERMSGRRSCPVCGAVYHIRNVKPKVDGRCDNDGVELVQRPDDQPEVVANRLKTYHSQTRPVIAYYRKHNTVHDIDAGREADETSSEVFEILDALVKP